MLLTYPCNMNMKWKWSINFLRTIIIMSTYLLAIMCLWALMQIVNEKCMYSSLCTILYFCPFHSPTAVTHPCLLLKLPPPRVEITHWKQVAAVTSWLLTVRVVSATPPGSALPWRMKGPLVIPGMIVWSGIEASPITSQFGRKEVVLYWHVTLNMVGTGWLSQKGTFRGSRYPTCMEQMYAHVQSCTYIYSTEEPEGHYS